MTQDGDVATIVLAVVCPTVICVAFVVWLLVRRSTFTSNSNNVQSVHLKNETTYNMDGDPTIPNWFIFGPKRFFVDSITKETKVQDVLRMLADLLLCDVGLLSLVDVDMKRLDPAKEWQSVIGGTFDAPVLLMQATYLSEQHPKNGNPNKASHIVDFTLPQLAQPNTVVVHYPLSIYPHTASISPETDITIRFPTTATTRDDENVKYSWNEDNVFTSYTGPFRVPSRNTVVLLTAQTVDPSGVVGFDKRVYEVIDGMENNSRGGGSRQNVRTTILNESSS
eukprot:PhF_6_TR11281/c0_g1_i2/m.18205